MPALPGGSHSDSVSHSHDSSDEEDEEEKVALENAA
jgi:hypothetical protein